MTNENDIFELLKDLDITSVAISYICFKNEILFNIIKENAALFDFMPCCSPQGGHPDLVASECLITLISNLNLMKGLN